MPETSIIIRTFNEEKHIGNILNAIKKQEYQSYEVIIVDSGSTDKTLEIARTFETQVITIKSRDFTFGYALNVGCRAARGTYLVFASAHVLPVDNKWLGNLISPLRNNKKTAMVYGRQIGASQSKFSEKLDFKRIFGTTHLDSDVPINYANNANSAIHRKLWESHPFDEYLFGLEDIDWARHMSAKGYVIRYEPTSVVYHIHEEAWYQVFNRYRREAIAAVRIGLDQPTQANIKVSWFVWRLIHDCLVSFPNWSFKRLEEIFRFRYYQWKGSWVGWRQGKYANLEKDKGDLFYPIINRSVVIKGKDEARLEEVVLPAMKPGDVLVKVDYVGICRTDLELLEGTLGYYRDGIAHYPIVPGHEFSGTIARIGSSHTFQERFKIGDKVVGECILSRNPEDRREVGVISHNGAYSTYIVMPGDAIRKVPVHLDQKKAALAEPLAVVLRAIRRIKHRMVPGAHVAVTGAGPIGFLCAQALVLQGYKVTVFDKNKSRLDLLRGIVTDVFESIENVKAFSVIIEATGSKEVLERIIKESHTDVTIMLLGFPYGDVHYNFEDLVGQEKVFAGSVGGDSEDFPEALSLLPDIELPDAVHAVMPLEDFEAAWKLHRTGKYLKIFLKP